MAPWEGRGCGILGGSGVWAGLWHPGRWGVKEAVPVRGSDMDRSCIITVNGFPSLASHREYKPSLPSI